jgi:hypothetical protein
MKVSITPGPERPFNQPPGETRGTPGAGVTPGCARPVRLGPPRLARPGPARAARPGSRRPARLAPPGLARACPAGKTPSTLLALSRRWPWPGAIPPGQDLCRSQSHGLAGRAEHRIRGISVPAGGRGNTSRGSHALGLSDDHVWHGRAGTSAPHLAARGCQHRTRRACKRRTTSAASHLASWRWRVTSRLALSGWLAVG